MKHRTLLGLALASITVCGGGSAQAVLGIGTAQAQVTGCPIGSTSIIGCYRVDGTTITVNGSGVISSIGGAATSIVVGTTTVGGGTTGRVLFDNGALLGEYSITGTGNVVLSAAPTITGAPTFSGTPLFSGLSNGTQVSCLGLDSGNHLVLNLSPCGTGGGGGSLTLTDGSHTVFGTTQITVTGGTVGGSTPNATLTISGGGGGGASTTTTITAATNIAAGTGVSLDSSGQGNQTWGAAPNLPGVVSLLPPSFGTGGPYTIKLDATHFITFNSTNTALVATPEAVACSISGTAISCGAPAVGSQFYGIFAVAVLNSSSFIIGFDDSTNANAPTLEVCSVSSLVITCGTPQVVAGDPILPGSNVIAAPTATTFVYTYLNGAQLSFVVGTISGTTITLGTPGTGTLPNSAAAIIVAPLTSSTVVISYVDGGTGLVRSAIGSISGTTLTEGTPVSISGSSAFGSILDIAAIDSTHFVISWTDSVEGRAAVGSVSGTTVTMGSSTKISGNNTLTRNSIALLSTSEVAFQTSLIEPTVCSVSTVNLTCVIGVPIHLPYINGTYTFNYQSAYFPPLAILDGTHFMWVDGSWNLYEETSGGIISSPIHHQQIYSYALYPVDSTHLLTVFTDYDQSVNARVITYEPINNGPIGCASSPISASASGSVVTSGECSGFSGLTAGQYYYWNGDGTVVTANTGHGAGYALTSSKISLKATP